MKKKSRYKFDSRDTIPKSQNRNLNIFWAGFIIYFMAYTLSATNYVSFIVFQAIQIIGVVLIIFPLFKIVSFKIDNSYLRVVYIIYCSWLGFLILQGLGLLLDYGFLKNFLFDPTYGGILYLAPLLLVFPQNLTSYKKIFDVIFIMCVIYIIYDIVFLRDLLNSDWENLQSQGMVELSSDLSFPCGFLLLTYPYHSKHRNILAVLAIALTLLFSIIRARRGLILMTSGIILASYLLYFFTTRKKILVIYLSILAVSVVSIYAVAVYKPNKNIFGGIMHRGAEDTRTGVELFFYADMNLKDWIIGRGINGVYYCPGIVEDAPTNYRSVIETGYLQTILKGGLMSLGLFLLIAIPAIIYGLFYSKNLLSKGSAIWILLALLSMYPATVNSFTLRYLLVWVAIGICYSKSIRNLPEFRLKEYFLADSSSKSG